MNILQSNNRTGTPHAGIHRHYGWVICIACLLMHACCCGLAASMISIYVPYIKDVMELTNAQTSLVSTMRAISSMIFILTADRFYHKVSLRAGACIACLILTGSSVLMGFAPNVVFVYAATAGLGLAYAYGTMVPIALFMKNWFTDHRGTAIAIAACGSAVTSTLAPPVFTGILERHGLTPTLLVQAGIALICAVILFILLRSKPADLGLEPYQDTVPAQQKSVSSSALKKKIRKGLNKKETLLFLISVFLIGSIGPPYLAHITLHFRTIGFTPELAALSFSIIGFLMVVSKFLFGAASDKFGTYPINFIYIGSLLGSCLIAALLPGGSFWIYPASVLGGIGISLVTIGITIWSTDLARDEDYGKMVERSQSANALGVVAFSMVPGILADLSGGSYRPAYLLFAGMSAAILFIIQRIYRKHLITERK